MENSQITCDFCKQDLTYTGNSIDYRLALTNQRILPNPKYDSVTDQMIYPKIDQNSHFCDIICLKNWINNEPKI